MILECFPQIIRFIFLRLKKESHKLNCYSKNTLKSQATHGEFAFRHNLLIGIVT